MPGRSGALRAGVGDRCEHPGVSHAQSGRGATPGRARTAVTEAVRVIEGTGRSSCTPTQATAATTMTAPATSTRDRSFQPPPAAWDRTAGRPAPRSRRLPPLTAPGRNSLRRMRHHHYSARPASPARHPAARQVAATASRLVAAMVPALRKR